MHTCVRCGRSLNVSDRFCSKCGTSSNNYSDPAVQRKGGRLDLRMLAIFIIIAGLLVFSYGGLIYISSQPTATSASTQELDPKKGDFWEKLHRESIRNPILENMVREERRKYGVKMMLYGAVISIAGLAIRASIRKE